ncbi:MAG TPA: SufS family cysteine desulfurase [Baekduia sp.]|uniref:aminotransferase class V-fold PLP-dependent enzyme n=1 Tax=Baekduia sp. TaxID=2600305 RepID=UPI002D792DB5|nr:SufS family cysteine desulfurase [Baekduia sp.]HET6506547.1 SufS family cysteine desulfurase [Baekduia sp.]
MAATTQLDVRSRFPTLAREGVAYLDSAATSQTPDVVLAAMDDYYRHHRASVHRGTYPLAVEATDLFEGARTRIARALNWAARDTVFTRNASEALNVVAHGWGRRHVGAGDRILVTRMEHHSNFVPWWMLARDVGAELVEVPVDAEGLLDRAALSALLPGAKVLAVAHVSNVVGTINPVAEIVREARSHGVVTVIDGSQAVPQIPVDLGAIDADFYAWTGHKAYGPTGVGVLHGRHDALLDTEPLIGGGHMISSVSFDDVKWAAPPARFEAGTSAIAEVIGLGAAIDWLFGELGMEAVRAHEAELTAYALERLGAEDDVTIHGPRDVEARGALVSFALNGVHPHDVSEILGRRGVCVRAGHHCAQPLMQHLGESATTRASFAVHTTREEVDQLVDGLAEVRRIFA